MKRLLFVALMMTCSVSWADWTLAGKTDDHSFFVDKSTKRKSGNIVKMWALRDYSSPQTSGVLKYSSTVILYAYDCKEEAAAIVSITGYVGAMGGGNVVQTETFQQREWDWQPVMPSSVGKINWEIACGLK
jgi:hypothetical protein